MTEYFIEKRYGVTLEDKAKVLMLRTISPMTNVYSFCSTVYGPYALNTSVSIFLHESISFYKGISLCRQQYKYKNIGALQFMSITDN